MLQLLRREGWDLRSICDSVADARANAGVQESSARTYDAHLRGVEVVCGLLGECAFPAKLETIRRVSSVVGNPTTLRGWLAAWRRLHCVVRLPWAGDRDPFLISVRTGLRRCIGPTPPKKRCRKGLLRRLATAAVQRQWWSAGAFCVLAYTFGLRPPSELMRQASAELFWDAGPHIAYGPIRCKGQPHPQTLKRWCVCEQDQLLCPHAWIQILTESRPSGSLFKELAQSLMRQVVELLRALGVADASVYTSHCFRRGVGVDVLETHRLKAMLEFGHWSTPRSAEPYASADEHTAQAVGCTLVDFSDENI